MFLRTQALSPFGIEIADHSQVQGDRVLHRGLVLGDRPITA